MDCNKQEWVHVELRKYNMDNEAQKVNMVNCSKHFIVGQNFKLSNKIPQNLN